MSRVFFLRFPGELCLVSGMTDGRITECDGNVFNEIKGERSASARDHDGPYIYINGPSCPLLLLVLLRQEAGSSASAQTTRRGLFECGLDGYQETLRL